MIIPVRCFTCGKTLADKYDWYQEEVDKLMEKEKPEKKAATTSHSSTEKKAATKKTVQNESIQEAMKHFEEVQTGEILNKLGLTRYCCRRHMLGHVDMMKVI